MSTSAPTETYVSDSPERTAQIAADAALRLAAGDIVLLRGELGSGKTVFVRGAADALGFTGRVTSPTFAIGNVYSGAELEIAHLDLYRLGEIEIDDEAVVGDFLTPQRIGFVEWPHDQLGVEAKPRAIVSLAHAGEDRRTIEIDWIDAK
ncbi:MAG: tRNA (adenosine(37)-N6)-threonylcarbamoyltransferase complex ATPase subunit type 1 TsaE [Solirubrobacterales bacterium]